MLQAAPTEDTNREQQRGDHPRGHHKEVCLDGVQARAVVDDLAQGVVEVAQWKGLDDGGEEWGRTIRWEVGASEEHHREAHEKRDCLRRFGGSGEAAGDEAKRHHGQRTKRYGRSQRPPTPDHLHVKNHHRHRDDQRTLRK